MQRGREIHRSTTPQAEALVTVLSGLAKRRPLILCIEDAENLDADSISVLDALVAQLDTLQLSTPGYRCHRLRGAVCFPGSERKEIPWPQSAFLLLRFSSLTPKSSGA